MSALKKIEYLSEEEYLQYELGAEIRHEYVDGQVYAMAGASENHARICMNIAFHLRGAARGGDCGVFLSDMKLKIPESRAYYYPDVMLLCKRAAEDDDYYKHQPCFVAEVASKSTRATDRREKLWNYQKIASLKYYLLVDSLKKKIEYFRRDDVGNWQQAILEDEETLNVQCGDYQAILTLDDIYEDVDFG